MTLSCFAILVHIGIYFSGLYIPVGTLHDPDCYMRLVQVQDLLQQGFSGWSDHIIDRDNAPYGSEMHWSRAVDIGILTLYFPLQLFLTSQDALFLSGLLFSTLLLAPCLIWISQVAREFLALEGRLLTMLIFLVQPGILNYFAFARPDHHALILTCFVGSISLGTMTLLNPGHLRYSLAAALCVTIGLWASIESIIGWLILTICFALAWLFNQLSAKLVACFQTTICIGSTMLVLLETPAEVFELHSFDRLSGVHILMLGLVALCWWMLTRVHGNLLSRLVAAGLSGTVAITIWFAAFPEALSGPFGQVAPELKVLWLNHVQELHPLGNGPLSLITGILAWIPAMLPGLYIFRQWYLKRKEIQKNEWILWSSWLMAMIITSLLALYQKRWIAYAGIIWTPTAAWSIYQLLLRIQSVPGFRVYRALILLIVCTGPALLSLSWERNQHQSKKNTSSPLAGSMINSVVTANSLPAYLIDSPEINQSDQTILCFIDQGPEILYRTHASVIASPYHRNHQGVIAAHTALSATDLTIALEIVTRRGIQWIITGANEAEASYYGTHATLYQQLCMQQPPKWLTLQASVTTPFGMYYIYHTYLSDP